jgi:hypothetical protein
MSYGATRPTSPAWSSQEPSDLSRPDQDDSLLAWCRMQENIEFGSTTSDASWINTWARWGFKCQFHNHKDIGRSRFNLFVKHSTIQCLCCLLPVLLFDFCSFCLLLFNSVLLLDYSVHIFRSDTWIIFQVFQSRYSIYNNHLAGH